MVVPQLHSRFRPPADYLPASYRLLPFRFARLDDGRAIVTNLTGDVAYMPISVVHQLIAHELPTSSPWFDLACSRLLVASGDDDVAIDLLAEQYRARHAQLGEGPSLHMIVVTLRCDHSCGYCQVSRVSEDRAHFDMTPEIADRVVDLIFTAPGPRIKIEFQGGESLLNFPIIVRIVERAERLNAVAQRDLAFVIASNLSHLSEEILSFCLAHRISLSTSLDGPEDLHNANRPRADRDSHARAVAGIGLARARLGHDAVSALMTTTARSLDRPERIVDEYLGLGFTSIFLRRLSPFGFAAAPGSRMTYSVQEWNRFYERGLRHIIACNRAGRPMREEFAAIILRKMLRHEPVTYVDLASPAALGSVALAWDYTGEVYPSDEARMLAATGDKTFLLGHALHDEYASIAGHPQLRALVADTMHEATPGCATCPFAPWCGTDPVYHWARQGDPMGHRPTSDWCARHMATFHLLLRLLEDPESAPVLKSWVC